MKNLKFLIVFLAGVAFTLLVTGNVPHFGRFVFSRVSIPDELSGVLGVMALIITGAFLAARQTTSVQSRFDKFLQFLRDFRASKTDCWLGGICGALGRRTTIPSWVWRLAFAMTCFYYGSGVLVYFLLWIFIPVENGVTGEVPLAEPQPSNAFGGFLRSLKLSTKDYWVGGVCGGLAEESGVPSWVWRLVFAGMMFCYGSGLLVYLLLWVFLPREEAKNPATT